ERLRAHARRGPVAEEIGARDWLEPGAARRRERPHLRFEPERTALQTLDPECELRHGGIRLLDAKELLRLHAEGMLAARSFAVEGSRALRHPCAPGTRALHTTGGAERRADDQAGRRTLAAVRGTGRGVVIFPSAIVPLLISRGPSLRLVEEALGGDRMLGLFSQKNPEEEHPEPEGLYSRGTAGRILKMLKYPDGSVRILVQGLKRIEVIGYTQREPYFRAKV